MPATIPSSVCRAMLVVAGFLAGLASVQSAAADAESSAAQAANYSTGRSGGKLKWLPQQPESTQAETVVTVAAHTKVSSSPSVVRTAQSQTPKASASSLGDPFGDKKNASSTAPAEKLNEDPQQEFKERCPSPKDLKPVAELTTNITPSEGELPHDCPLGNATFQARAFAPITYTWTASGLCHKPLYFEDVQLERYGHMVGPWVQPFASGAHFFLTFPILPYKMGLELPNECMYPLGYYRPGNCAPYLFDPIPLSVRGALFEGGAWVGGVYAFP